MIRQSIQELVNNDEYENAMFAPCASVRSHGDQSYASTGQHPIEDFGNTALQLRYALNPLGSIANTYNVTNAKYK